MTISMRTLRSFERVDGMSPELRECVHEFGEPIVQACLQAGVREPRKIRALVREIWDGARQPNQRRTTLGTLDWMLSQAGAQINAKTLVRILANDRHFIVPEHPTREMIQASMATVSNFNFCCTKEEKHRMRLRAALKAGVQHIWPEYA